MTRHARVSREDTATRLHALAIHLLRRVRRTDAATGLTPARASVLSVLVFGGPRTLGELAATELVAPPTMTRLVSGLEQDGYVTRRGDAQDARVSRVRATAKGRRVLEAGRARRIAQVMALLERLDDSEVRRVAEVVALLEPLLE